MAVSKITKKTPSWEYVGDVYWWDNTWTCPADGFIEINVTPSSNAWHWYIYDSSAPNSWSHCMTGNNQNQQNMVFPAKKGAVFGTASIGSVSAAHVYYYKFV